MFLVFPKKINFDLPDSVKRKIHYAETALGDQIAASETYMLEFTDYGKRFIIANKLSPDSYVQMSMMLAYFKLYGKFVCAYEPVLTKSFFHGRTEAMRPATLEAKHLCEVFCNPTCSPEEKLSALRNAARVHSELVKECARGKGVDRHLYALKCIAERNRLPTPAFFNSEPWAMLNHTVLSTSNCGNPSLALFGFGPVVPDGLGIGYIIKDTCLHYAICSKHRQTTRYAMTLVSVLKEMAKLMNPLSHTKVRNHHRGEERQQRLSLKQIPVNAISYDAYGDVWGESTPTRQPKKRDINLESRLPTMPLPCASDHSTALLKDETSGAAQERRWSAEDIIPLCDKDLSESEDDIVVPLALDDHEDIQKGNSNKSNDGSFTSPTRQFKRRGSNDQLPTYPNRRKSNDDSARPRSKNMVGYAKRQSSFEYSELSKKGDAILFEKVDDAKEGTYDIY
jgi:hypothetical protein